MKTIRILALSLLVLCFAVAFASCSLGGKTTAPESDKAEIVSAGEFTIDGTNVSVTVPNATDVGAVLNQITVSEKAVWKICTDPEGQNECAINAISLSEGDNVFYLFVTSEDGTNTVTYTVTVRRRPIYTVSFETNGGTAVAPVKVEEGENVTAPTVTRPGYSVRWDYDFSQPVGSDLTVTANWTVINYPITYNLGGGTNAAGNPAYYTVEDNVTLAAPTREGYVFAGWYMTNNEKITTLNGRSGALTLTAGWESRAYSTGLSFLPNGIGTCYVDDVGTCTDQDIIIPPVSPTGETVVGIGDEAFYHCSDLTSVTIPEGVVYIEDDAFYGCYELRSVSIPDSLIVIGKDSFYECDDLQYNAYDAALYLGNADNPYVVLITANDENVTSCTIHENTKLICEEAFSYCRSLTDVTIPDSVTSIGDGAFAYCSGLTSVTIPNSVTSIGDSAFYRCSGLTSIAIGRGVRTIGEGAFVVNECFETVVPYDPMNPDPDPTPAPVLDSTLVSVTVAEENPVYHSAGNCLIETASKTLIAGCKTSVIPTDGSVTSIGDDAFFRCYGLTSVTIPDSVTSIGEEAFSGCSNLASVSVGNGVTEIGKNAFSGCTALQYATYDNGLYLGNGTNPYVILMRASDNGVTSCAIHETTRLIYERAFYECASLTSVTIPDSVTNIGGWGWAFEGCSGLTSVTIPDGVTRIAEGTFAGCSALTSFTIPSQIVEIERWAFSNCNSLSSVIFAETDGWYVTRYSISSARKIDVTDPAANAAKLRSGNYEYDGKWFRGSAGTDGLEFISNNDGTCTVVGIGTCEETDLVIPTHSPAGDLVVRIESEAFYNRTGLTSLTVPESVTYIGEVTFAECTGLTRITVAEGNPVYHSAENCLIETASKKLVVGCNTSVIPTDGSVTNIGIGAFYGCSFSSIVIPESVTIIGAGAFAECSSLASITIPAGVTYIGESAFWDCTALTEFVIPDGVTRIEENTFDHCSSLTSITIPDSVTSIGDEAFDRCEQLTDVYYIGDVAGWCGITFDDNPLFYADNLYINGALVVDLVIPDGVTAVKDDAFYGLSSLRSVVIPDSVTFIGWGAFEDCSGLTSVTIGRGVTEIEDDAFYGCSKLIEIRNLSALELTPGDWENGRIAYYAQHVYSDGESALHEIGDYLFYDDGNEALLVAYYGTETDLTLPTDCHGRNYAIYQGVFEDNTALHSLVISDGVTSIGDYAFYDCTGLTSITIGTSVTSIGEEAFAECSGLTSVTIGNGVTSIGDGAFRNCSGLTSVTIPDSVTSIGWGAFFGCSGLTSIVVAEENPIYHSAGNCLIETESKTLILGCSTSVIPTDGSVTAIGNGAFAYCSGLNSITIPDSVTSIGYQAFEHCSALESVTFERTSGWRRWSKKVNVTDPAENAENLIWSYENWYWQDPGPNGLAFASNGDGTCTVVGVGTFGEDDLVIPTYSPAGDRVTSIGDRAFEDCSDLISVIIPDSVTSIKDSAFAYCSGLTSVTIGSGVTSIEDWAFYDCSKLIEICNLSALELIPGDWKNGSVAYYAQRVYSDGESALHEIGDYLFYDDGNEALLVAYNGADANLTLPADCHGRNYAIYFGAFVGNTTLRSLIIPDGVTSIGSSAFEGCYKLTSITIPDSVTSIGSSAFRNCSGLTSVTVGSGVTSIGNGAFAYCSDLTSVTIPGSVTSIGNYAFYGCDSLCAVTFANTDNWYVNEWGAYDGIKMAVTDSAVNAENLIGDYYNYYWFWKDFGPGGLNFASNGDGTCAVVGIGTCEETDLVIPTYSPAGDLVVWIGIEAFYNCTGLTSVTIGSGVTSIGDYAFRNCSGLTSVTIPDSVTSIGWYAFEGCTGLTSVTIGNGVTNIAEGTFAGCSSLSSVSLPDSLTLLGENAFSECPALHYNTYDNGRYLGNDDNPYVVLMGVIDTNVTSFIIPEGTRIIYDNAFKGCTSLTSVTIPDGVTSIGRYAFRYCSGMTSVTIPNSVTSIGDGAFAYCSGLTSITIPDSVTSIGRWAFEGCSGLTSVTIPDSVTSIGNYAFAGCSGLTSITIPDSVTSIRDSAFSRCSGLTSIYYTGDVADWCGIRFDSSDANPLCYAHNLYLNGVLLADLVIPDSVTAIKAYTFYNCSGLTSVTIPNSVTSIEYNAFRNCTGLTSITIPDSVTSIEYNAFRNCTGLTSVTIGSGVTSIGGLAFAGCSKLTSVTIPDNVTSIGGSAFEGCSGLTSITIPDSVTSIGDSAFYRCSGLTSVIIPGSVTSIGNGAFAYCSGLTSITIPDSVTNIGEAAFAECSGLICITVAEGNPVYHSAENCLIETASKTLIAGCKISVIPTDGSVTSIGNGAFSGCTGLTSITIPDNVTSIGRWAFEGCSGLISITIPDGVTSIGDYAFQNCSGLTSITIPDSVTSIGNYAFYCSGMTSVTIPNSVTSIGGLAFYGCSGLTSIVFLGTEEEWNAIEKETEWDRGTGDYTIHCTDGDIAK